MKDQDISLESTYKYVRDYIVHEDSLINFRLNWLLVIQGLLFAAYGLSIRESSLANIHEFRKVISFVGTTTCILIFLSIFSAVIAIKNLEAFWEKRKKDENQENLKRLPFITGGTDPIFNKGDGNLKRLHRLQDKWYIAFLSPLCIPIVFLSAWIHLMFKF